MTWWGGAHWQRAVDVALGAALATIFLVSGAVVSVPLAVAQLLPLAWRRHAPQVVLALVGGATAAHTLAGMSRSVGFLPVTLALYSAAAHRSPWIRWGTCGTATAVVVAASGLRHGPVEGGLLAVVVCVVAWLAGVERGEHVRERTAYAAENTRLRWEQTAARQTAAAAQARERLSRRLHDTLAHTVTVMLVQAEALRSTASLAPADRDRLDRVLAAGREALADVRAALADQAEADPAATLADRLRALREAGLRLPPALPDGLDDLPAPARALAHRLIGETATNALRHDGVGSRLDIAVDRDDDVLTVALTSSAGRATGGPAPRGAGFGLRSLAVDVEAHGGTLRHGRSDGSRWRVVATLPLRPPG
ncbi:histidine kinase [Micromonospora sp. NBC_01655]|uniref:sensor histidine kinase n=1 Tax=Micromonospora sp. NBC_01655 TaxID=2975983 RepID=UPI0022586CC6|nr:histidine kinase [Micromonospora sp. NBC_01655]MCX4471196.1 histidine kinase [Micromonospora sp. NBC_01655]